MTPTETLKHEHKIVLLVLQGAEREARAIRAGGEVNGAAIAEMVDFFRNFVDRCHHAKEERYLFPAMGAAGFPAEAGPVAVMLHEHEQGRALIRAIGEALDASRAGDARAKDRLAAALEGYAELLRSHIYKEDNILFAMADQVLPPAEQERLAGAFERVEAEEIGPGVHERYHELAHRLAGV